MWVHIDKSIVPENVDVAVKLNENKYDHEQNKHFLELRSISLLTLILDRITNKLMVTTIMRDILMVIPDVLGLRREVDVEDWSIGKWVALGLSITGEVIPRVYSLVRPEGKERFVIAGVSRVKEKWGKLRE